MEETNDEGVRLRPVVMPDGKTSKHSQNDLAQRLILKALNEGITDVKDLRKLAGLKSVAEVYRTMDKMALRREYHNALAACGVDFMYLVSGIKGVVDSPLSKDKDRLKGLEMLLRSVGLDKYDKMEDSGKSWEEAIIALSSGDPSERKEAESSYEVEAPKMPDDEAEKERAEREFADTFYA